jgi:hypothetical protein
MEMQHGDIQLRISLSGEPQQLLTYWRGSLRDNLPTRAGVTILRPRPKRQWWGYFGSPNFNFEAITRAEKKRAELGISDKALMMQADEIAIARELTETLFNWLSGRQGTPAINQPIPKARISLHGDGGPELVGVIESFGDPEVLWNVEIGPVYTQGEPRRPDVRWLPALNSTDKTIVLGALRSFAKSLADGQGPLVLALIDRVTGVFRKRLALRKAEINKRVAKIFGYGAALTIEDEPITDEKIENDYEDILAWLEEQTKEHKPKEKIRAWRDS